MKQNVHLKLRSKCMTDFYSIVSGKTTGQKIRCLLEKTFFTLSHQAFEIILILQCYQIWVAAKEKCVLEMFERNLRHKSATVSQGLRMSDVITLAL